MKIDKKNNFIKRQYDIFLFLFCFFAVTGVLKADDTVNLGKEISSKWENIIVTVKIVMKQKIIAQGREVNNSENKMEIGGTIIEDSGLVIVSLSAIEPSSVFDNIVGEMAEGRQFKYESEITDLKIRFTKENEVNAKIVLRDKDLDLAFIRPTTKLEGKVLSLNLKDSIQPELLDRILILDRLGKIANEALYVSTSRIQAIVNKPRLFYVPEMDVISRGLPVFSLEKGKIIGILVLRMMVASSSMNRGSSIMNGGRDTPILPIILPASQIIEVASQVPPYESK